MSVLGIVVAQSHDHSSHTKMNETHVKAINQYKVDPVFQTQLQDVVASNQKLSEAFLNDDKESIINAATEIKSKLEGVDMMLLKGEAHHKWMEYLKEMKHETKQIIESDDMANQRIHLAKLNDALYKSLKAFGTDGTEVYYNHCPMANGSGASWLTTFKGIQNPYMGQKMPKCGSNKEVLN